MIGSVVGVSVIALVVVLVVCSSVNSAAVPEERPYYDDPFLYATDSEGGAGKTDLKALTKWSKSRLTYSIVNYPVGVREKFIRSTVRRAFDAWSRVTNLDFVENVNTSQVDMQLGFEGMYHSRRGIPCQYGHERTLAHTFLPEAGDIHFNTKFFFDDENISLNEFLNTAVHEIGHALGLPHSDSKLSIMYGAQLKDPFTEPQPEDIDAIQAAYGIRSATGKTTTTSRPRTTTSKVPSTQPTKPRTKSELCSLTSYDTIVRDYRGNICLLAGQFYYNLNETNSPARKISTKWPGLPPNVDAAIDYLDGKTYFFKEDKYWKYDQRNLQVDYPRSLAKGFPGVSTNIDAILLIKTGGFVVFKGSHYWLYDTSKSEQGEVHPKPIGDILGFSGRLDAAVTTTEGRRFVFSGMKYYEVSDANRVIGGKSDVRKDWFKC